MYLVTKGPFKIPHSLILGDFSKAKFYPHTCKGFNLPQTVETIKGFPRIPIYKTLEEFGTANPKPY